MGEILVDAAVIRGIVREADAIVKDVNTVLNAASEIVKTLADTSEGGFIDTLKNIWTNLSELFGNLIKAFQMIFTAIGNALDALMTADRDGVSILNA